MNLYINIKFFNGDIYKVPIEIIAMHRTSVLVKNNDISSDSFKWKEIYDSSKEEDILKDWIKTSMTWNDIKNYSLKITNNNTHIDYNFHFNNIEIIKHEINNK